MSTNERADKGLKMKNRNDTARARSALLAVIAGLAFLLPAPVANAQEGANALWLACDRLSVPANRLACFNDIVRRLKAGEAAPIEDRARSPVADSGPVAVETSRPAAAAANTLPKDFGLKKKLKPEGINQADPFLTAKVVRHWENSVGRLVVQLDNDQIWTEVVSYDARIPKGEATVEIKSGKFGGYRMRINDIVGLVMVKRLK